MIHLHITGFGPFLDVTENPSSTIMKMVGKYFGNKKNVKVVSQDELEVSVQAVEQYINNTLKTEQEENNNDTAAVHFFLHFGINRGSKETIAIETEAENCVWIPPNDHSKFETHYCSKISSDTLVKQQTQTNVEQRRENEQPSTTFSADHAGDQVMSSTSTTISTPPPPTTTVTQQVVSTRITSLQSIIKEICSTTFEKMITVVDDNHKSEEQDEKEKEEPKRFKVAPSVNAGKYLCNFIFYLSLAKLSVQQSVQNVRSLGIEVPSFVEMFNRNIPYLLRNKQQQQDEKVDTTAVIINRNKNHSLFIHVMDPSRVSEKQQADAICIFLEKLFEKLL